LIGRKNLGSLSVTINVTGLEVNAKKTKHTNKFTSYQHNAG